VKFVVAGAGYTGRRVLASLPAGSALALSRRPVDSGGQELRLVDFDARHAEPIRLPSPCCLLYTAPPGGDGGDARLAGLLARLTPAPARVVYLSTSGVYGDRRGAVVDESAGTRAQSARAKRRVAAERLLGDWCRDRGAELYVLRVPAIYGPGRLGLDRLRAGDPVLRDADAGPGNRIHVDDLVECCLAAMQTQRAPPGIYNVGDGDDRSSSSFSRAVARLAGLPPPPELDLGAAARTWSRERMSFVAESRRLDTRRMREVLGVRPKYGDPEDGIRASLAEEARSGQASAQG